MKFQQLSIFTRTIEIIEEHAILPYKVWKERFSNYPQWEVDSITVGGSAKSSILPQNLRLIYLNHMGTQNRDQLVVFTDGSITAEGVAYALTGYQPSQPVITRSERLQDDSSNCSAELHAILHTARISLENGICPTLVFTNSKSAMQAISRPFSKAVSPKSRKL